MDLVDTINSLDPAVIYGASGVISVGVASTAAALYGMARRISDNRRERKMNKDIHDSDPDTIRAKTEAYRETIALYEILIASPEYKQLLSERERVAEKIWEENEIEHPSELRRHVDAITGPLPQPPQL